MICSKCGSEIKDDSLYCENCGDDIHIVPDYEPELEHNIKETIGNLMDNFIRNEDLDDELDDLFDHSEFTFRFDKIKHTKIFFVFCGLLVVILIGGVVWFGTHLYSQRTFDYQQEMGLEALEAGNYTDAIKFFEKAMLYDADNLELKFILADTYYKNNKKDNAINLLYEIIYAGNYVGQLTNAQLEDAYRSLFSLYEEQEKYDNIYQVLTECNNQTILSEYSHYNVSVPAFSLEEGVYTIELPLKITSSLEGNIYYTTDGTTPTKFSKLYSGTIFLEKGLYNMTAIYINDYGISSEIVKAQYIIEISETAVPQIYTPSGVYTEETMIEIAPVDGVDIFYTMDGTDPDETSIFYIEPLMIPEGETEFRFIAISDSGIKSEIITCKYILEIPIHTGDDSDALYQLKDKLISMGRLSSFNGMLDGMQGAYVYNSLGIITATDGNSYYGFVEIHYIEEGNSYETGNVYAVNIHTMECYALSILENNVYIINTM